MQKENLIPLIWLYLYGQKLKLEQVLKIRRSLTKILIQSGIITVSEAEKIAADLFLPNDGESDDQAPEVLFLCTLMLSERLSDSFDTLRKLRQLLIEFLLRSDPPLLSIDEVKNTFLLVSKNPNKEWSNNYLFFYDTHLVVLPPKLVPRAAREFLVVVPTEKDELLSGNEKFGALKVERRFYSNCSDGGYYGLFLKIEESLSDDCSSREENLSEATEGLLENEVISKKDLVNLIFGDIENKGRKQIKISPPTSGSRLIIPETVESPGIAEFRSFLERSVIGQNRAIREIARALNIAKAGIFPPQRPLLVQFWAGPTGVGKTELAISIAKFIWEREKKLVNFSKERGGKFLLPFTEKDILLPPLVRVDCGMFGGSLSHGVSNLIGSPVGYVGSKGSHHNPQPPILSASRFPPNRLIVLLFDEFEKAIQNSRDGGAEIIGILMDILDRGEFQNNWGEVVSFQNAIIIFTSNIGSIEIVEEALESGIGFKIIDGRNKKDVENLNKNIYEKLKRRYERTFPPEFRSRIHRFIVFRFLSNSDYLAIIEKEFEDIKRQAKQKWNIDLELTKAAISWLLSEIDVQEGVRKLRDLMYREIVEPLARAYNLGLLWPTTYLVDVNKEGDLTASKKKLKLDFLVK